MISTKDDWASLWNIVQSNDRNIIEKLRHAKSHQLSHKIVKGVFRDRWLVCHFRQVNLHSLFILCIIIFVKFETLPFTFKINNRDLLFLINFLWRSLDFINIVLLSCLHWTAKKFVLSASNGLRSLRVILSRLS